MIDQDMAVRFTALLEETLTFGIRKGFETITDRLPSAAERRTYEIFRTATQLWIHSTGVSERDCVDAAIRLLNQATLAVAEEAAPDPKTEAAK